MEEFWIWYFVIGLLPCVSLAKGFVKDLPNRRYLASVVLYFGLCLLLWPIILVTEWVRRL